MPIPNKKMHYLDEALAYKNNVLPLMAELRKPVDEAELITDKRKWPFPSYADLLFKI